MQPFGAEALGWREPLIGHRDLNSAHDDLKIFYPIGDVKSKGDFMSIDLYAKAVHLLERIANSIHEREPKNPNLLCFSTIEVQVVEEWLDNFVTDIRLKKPVHRET